MDIFNWTCASAALSEDIKKTIDQIEKMLNLLPPELLVNQLKLYKNVLTQMRTCILQWEILTLKLNDVSRIINS